MQRSNQRTVTGSRSVVSCIKPHSLKKWEHDKWRHFYVGMPLGVFLYAAPAIFLRWQPSTSLGFSLVALAALCYGFELFSLLTGKGHYEMMDAIAGFIGGSIGILIAWLSF
ncbi:MAG: hypothetical protein JWQ27_583 [Ferruginibacter sp.]|nr:hypothetical protein [Ferruginibacter sp.]